MANKKYLDYEGLQTLVQQIRLNFATTGALQYIGSVATVAQLPALTTAAKAGWIYSFTADATTTADFIEGAGKKINANDEVVCVLSDPSDETSAKKWQILGPVFDVADRLQFGSTFPASPADTQTFLYMGNTTYTYNSVTPEGTEDPSEEGWYVSDGSGGYVVTTDTEVQSGTTYYTRTEQYIKGVIYVYNASGSEWVAQSSGDAMIAITSAEVTALFE